MFEWNPGPKDEWRRFITTHAHAPSCRTLTVCFVLCGWLLLAAGVLANEWAVFVELGLLVAVVHQAVAAVRRFDVPAGRVQAPLQWLLVIVAAHNGTRAAERKREKERQREWEGSIKDCLGTCGWMARQVQWTTWKQSVSLYCNVYVHLHSWHYSVPYFMCIIFPSQSTHFKMWTPTTQLNHNEKKFESDNSLITLCKCHQECI